MWEVVLLIGLLITGASLYLMVRTKSALSLIDIVFATRWIYLAALLRLLLGAALIAAASAVKFPQTITVIGWLMALGGLVLVAVPQEPLYKMGLWFAHLPIFLVRTWLLLGLLFGGFMMYAALA
jgi:hypothetical protein